MGSFCFLLLFGGNVTLSDYLKENEMLHHTPLFFVVLFSSLTTWKGSLHWWSGVRVSVKQTFLAEQISARQAGPFDSEVSQITKSFHWTHFSVNLWLDHSVSCRELEAVGFYIQVLNRLVRKLNPAVDYRWVTTQEVTTKQQPLQLWTLVLFPKAPLPVKKCATHLDSDGQRVSPVASCRPCFSEGASSFPNVFCGPVSQVWTKSKRFVTLPIWRVRLTVLRKSFVCSCQRLNCGKLLPMGEVKGFPPFAPILHPLPPYLPISHPLPHSEVRGKEMTPSVPLKGG